MIINAEGTQRYTHQCPPPCHMQGHTVTIYLTVFNYQHCYLPVTPRCVHTGADLVLVED